MTEVIKEQESNVARWRKLLATIIAELALAYVQYASGEPITWPIAAAMFGVALAYVSADTIDKAFQSGQAANLAGRITGKG